VTPPRQSVVAHLAGERGLPYTRREERARAANPFPAYGGPNSTELYSKTNTNVSEWRMVQEKTGKRTGLS
jgi:hypothetical protein